MLTPYAIYGLFLIVALNLVSSYLPSKNLSIEIYLLIKSVNVGKEANRTMVGWSLCGGGFDINNVNLLCY